MSEETAEQRFEELYERYQRPVLGYFLRRTDPTTARDAAADTFLVAWRRIGDVPPVDEALPWLFGVARKVLANHRRSRDRLRALRSKLARVGVTRPPTPESIVIRHSEDDAMFEALARLSDADREVLRLAAWEQLPHSQTALVLGTSPHAVAQRLYRITKRLERDLRIHAGDGRAGRSARPTGSGGRT
jgi:RNA polymerase sigma-70 factor (ECF subfamily)